MPVGATPPLAVHALGADLNVYAYVGGRVASHTDAWGLCSQEAPGACIGGAYHPDAAGNQSGWSVGDGNSTYSPSGEHHGLVGEMFREWVANGRPSYAGLDWGAVTPELSLSGPAWDLAPAPGPIFDLGSIGAQAASAGGVPTFGSAIQESPSSRADWLAKQHPALRNSIRGAQRQETFIQAAPLIVAVLTYGASAAPEVAAEGAAAGGGGAGRLALGVSEHLDAFAARQGATTWKSFPDPMNWKTTMLEKLADPNTKILFNLEGPVEVWPGVSRAARGAGGATDWELLQVQQNPQWWNTIEWWQGGKQVPNPFE